MKHRARGVWRVVSPLMAIVIAVAFVVGACAPSLGKPGGSTSGGVVTIEHWDWWVTQGPTIDNEIKLFEAAHPNIKIKKTTQVVDKYPELLQLAMKGESAPDVFLIADKPDLIDQVRQGWLLPLNQWATPEWQKQFPTASFAEGANVFGGKVYTAPFDGPAPWLQLYLNTKLFREAGLVDATGNIRAPKTWDDVRELGRTITQKGGGKYYGFGFGNKQKFILPWQLMMVQNSGAPGGSSGYDARTGGYTWASNPAYQEWIEFFMGMKNDGSIVPNAMSMDDEMARAAFADGKFAMLIGGVWIQGGWQKTHPDFKDYTLVQLPYRGTQQDSYFYRGPGGKGFGISAKTKHPNEAWLWFEWLNSKAAAERWVKAGQGIRAFPEVNKPEYAPTPQFKAFMELAQGDIRLGPAPELLHPEMTQVKTQQTLPDIQAILEGVYTGQITDYKTALKDLEARQNAALQRAIAEAQARGVKLDPAWWRVADWDLARDYTTAVASDQR
ncbi:MAG: extracellular solute-binding protein [Chloroflexi bacterium]|nr:extracellular solute-binding protein [Chloroflexota bacterium]